MVRGEAESKVSCAGQGWKPRSRQGSCWWRCASDGDFTPHNADSPGVALREAYTPLTAEESDLLRRRYIHLSANWNAAKGWNDSALDVLFINRPASGMQRREHPNE